MFKRILIILAVVLVSVIGYGQVALAATQANVNVTATGAFMSITATPTSYDFGTIDGLAVSGTGSASTSQSALSVNSTSSITIHVLVSVATWTSGGTAWTYADCSNTTAYNTASINYSADTGLYNNLLWLTTTNLTDNLAAAGGKGFELRLFGPSDFIDGQQNTANITLQAYRA